MSVNLITATVAHFCLNDDTVNPIVTDSSVVGHDGTMKNGALNENTNLVSILGKINDAFNLNGSSHRVAITHVSNYNFGTSSFSVACWVNPDALSVITVLVSKGKGGNNKVFYVGINTSGTILAAIEGTGNQTTSTNNGSTVTIGNGWYHIIVVFDRVGNKIIRYLNGVQTGTQDTIVDTTTIDDSTDLIIGALDNGVGVYVNFLDGQIDDVRVFNRIITQDEINFIYNGGFGTEESSAPEYEKVVNIQNSSTLEYVRIIEFDPGDGSSVSFQASPFSYGWNAGTFRIIMQAAGYYSDYADVLMENEDPIYLELTPLYYVNECRASVGLITETDTLIILTWLLRNGEVYTAPIGCTISLRDKEGTVIFTDTSVTPEPNGIFKFEKNPSDLLDEGIYTLDITVNVSLIISYSTTVAVGKIQRERFTLNGNVYIDTINGVSGIVYPIGTFNKPSDNWDDAKIIADTNFIKRFIVQSPLTFGVGDDIGGYEFSGGKEWLDVEIGGGNTSGTVFRGVRLSGDLNGSVFIENCIVETITGLQGKIYTCELSGNITLAGITSVFFKGCYSEIIVPEINMGGSGRGLIFRDYKGSLLISNKSGVEEAIFDVSIGYIEFTPTVINGDIIIRGIVEVINNSTATIFADYVIKKAWAEEIVDNTNIGTFGEAVSLTKADTTTLILDTTTLKDDTTTLIADTITLKADTTTLIVDTTTLKVDTTILKADTITLIADTTLLKAEAVGKMVLNYSANTLTLYDTDNVTILKVFDLISTKVTLPSYVGRIPR